MENDTFNPDSTVVGPVASGAEQWEDIDKWVIGGATPGVGYEVGSCMGAKTSHRCLESKPTMHSLFLLTLLVVKL